jgi:hypothetical protein
LQPVTAASGRQTAVLGLGGAALLAPRLPLLND